MTRIVLLPGLGADARLFDPQRRAFPGLEVPDWLEPAARETLPAYARRMAASLAGSGDELVLGGVSFGGMVAYEMARHIPVRAVVLIASCRSGASLTPAIRALARAARRTPTTALRAGRPLWPMAAWALGASTIEARRLVRAFVRTADYPFIRWGLGAIADWSPQATPPCPVRAIHGQKDRLIRAGRVDAERVIAGAGHLVNVTHHGDVNAVLEAIVRGVVIREASPHERARVRAFYASCGHSGEFAAADRLLVAERQGQIVGAVRLCVEEGVQMLRTMRVSPDVQRRGVGRALLRQFETLLAPGPCYCLPYAHLTGFYGIIGFEEVGPEALPPHVAARLAHYRAERRGVNLIAMRRP